MSSETQTANQTQTQTMQVESFRKTPAQDVLEMRLDQQSKNGNSGEVGDNAVDWGKCDNLAILMYKTKTTHVDDGKFQNEERFNKLWTFKKDGTETRYTGNPSQIGRFNAGSTSSAMCMGDEAVAYTNLNCRVKKVILDVEDYITTGILPSTSEDASHQEAEKFITLQKMLNPDYSLELNCGTVIEWKRLLKNNTTRDINRLKKFYTGLYKPEKYQGSIKIWDFTNPREGSHILNPPEPTFTVSPYDNTYGNAPVEDWNVFVYFDTEEDKELHSLTPMVGDRYQKRFEYKIGIYALTQEQGKTDEELHQVKDTALVGVNFSRANRRVSERPLTWHFGLGADRLKYTRVNIDFPANEFADATFKCGTKKIVGADSWEHFPKSLQDLIAKIFKTIPTIIRRQKAAMRNAFTAKLVELTQDLETIEYAVAKIRFEKIEEFRSENKGTGKPIGKTGCALDKEFDIYKKALADKLEELRLAEEQNNDDDESKTDESKTDESDTDESNSSSAVDQGYFVNESDLHPNDVAPQNGENQSEFQEHEEGPAQTDESLLSNFVTTLSSAFSGEVGASKEESDTEEDEVEDFSGWQQKQQVFDQVDAVLLDAAERFSEISEWIESWRAMNQDLKNQEQPETV